jgi:hypothetical protein
MNWLGGTPKDPLADMVEAMTMRRSAAPFVLTPVRYAALIAAFQADPCWQCDENNNWTWRGTDEHQR